MIYFTKSFDKMTVYLCIRDRYYKYVIIEISGIRHLYKVLGIYNLQVHHNPSHSNDKCMYSPILSSVQKPNIVACANYLVDWEPNQTIEQLCWHVPKPILQDVLHYVDLEKVLQSTIGLPN